MLTSLEIQKKLQNHKKDLFKKYPIKQLGLFGSYARNEPRPDSDIDILVEFFQPVGFEVADLAFELENLLDHKVDLVTRKAITDKMLPYILKDLINA